MSSRNEVRSVGNSKRAPVLTACHHSFPMTLSAQRLPFDREFPEVKRCFVVKRPPSHACATSGRSGTARVAWPIRCHHHVVDGRQRGRFGGPVKPDRHIARRPPPQRTFCGRRCPGACHELRTSPEKSRG